MFNTASDAHKVFQILAIAGYIAGNSRVVHLAKVFGAQSSPTLAKSLLIIHAAGNEAHAVVVKSLEEVWS
jgi:hypothetical protein